MVLQHTRFECISGGAITGVSGNLSLRAPCGRRAGCWPRWHRPCWKSRWLRPGRPSPSGRRWTRSGGSAWNAPTTRQTGARRQYQLAEPENRLVALQLEKEWEAALAERQRPGEQYDRFTAVGPGL